MSEKRRIPWRESTGHLRGCHGDLEKPVRPTLCPLNAAAIGNELQSEVLEVLWRKEQEPEKRRKQQVFETLAGLQVNRSLKLARDRMQDLGYTAQVLLSRAHAGPAYRVLIDVIGALGPPSVIEAATQDRRRPDFHTAQIERATAGCRAFCSVFQPSCQTAYFRNRRLNRSYFLYEHGLKYPEAMRGFVWAQDLPTAVIFDERPVALYPPFPTESGEPQTPGNFREREHVLENRVIGVRLAWDQSRVALFMNWRSGDDSDDKCRPELRDIWAAMDKTYQKDERPLPALKPLELAVRYFTGWLSASGIDLSEAYDPKPLATPWNLIELVGQAAKEAEPEGRGLVLEGAIRSAVNLPDEHCNIHWTNESAEGGHPPRGLLRFKTGRYNDQDVETRPAFPLALDQEGLVERSICALAGTWKAPLFVADLERQITDTRRWRDIHYPRTGFKCLRELAVPIVDRHGVLGVANVECGSERLTAEHLRLTELITHLFQKLYPIYQTKGSVSARDLIDQLVDPGHSTKTAQRLCKLFCNWVASAFRADLVYLMIYDARVRVFRPLGTTVSRQNARAFLSDRQECFGLGIDEGDQAACGDLQEQYRTRAEKGGIHGLIEHAVASRLLPRRRGYAWQIFTTKEPRIRDSDEIDEQVRRYAKMMLGLPFCQDTNAQADGVLWISWQKRPKRSVGRRASPHKKREFVEKAWNQLRDVIEAVAAMYALYRYCDPDEASNPLPYPSPEDRTMDATAS
jgi:hypothetical protein